MRRIYILILITCIGAFTQAQPKHLTVADTVPNFSLPDQDCKMYSYKEQKSKGITVIFFYPKDNASISTRQAEGFKQHFKEFEEEGANIIGINPGTVESHKSFHQKNSLPYPLLSDKDNTVVNLFGIKTTMGSLNRETYVVDFTGRMVFLLDSFMDGARHAEEALKYIKSQD